MKGYIEKYNKITKKIEGVDTINFLNSCQKNRFSKEFLEDFTEKQEQIVLAYKLSENYSFLSQLRMIVWKCNHNIKQ